MSKYSPSELQQLAEYVRQHIETEDTYIKERMEAFDVKRQYWLIEAIKQALFKLFGLIDESLVEPIKTLLNR